MEASLTAAFGACVGRVVWGLRFITIVRQVGNPSGPSQNNESLGVGLGAEVSLQYKERPEVER